MQGSQTDAERKEGYISPGLSSRIGSAESSGCFTSRFFIRLMPSQCVSALGLKSRGDIIVYSIVWETGYCLVCC